MTQIFLADISDIARDERGVGRVDSCRQHAAARDGAGH
jgi:hypothetical protein